MHSLVSSDWEASACLPIDETAAVYHYSAAVEDVGWPDCYGWGTARIAVGSRLVLCTQPLKRKGVLAYYCSVEVVQRGHFDCGICMESSRTGCEEAMLFCTWSSLFACCPAVSCRSVYAAQAVCTVVSIACCITLQRI